MKNLPIYILSVLFLLLLAGEVLIFKQPKDEYKFSILNTKKTGEEVTISYALKSKSRFESQLQVVILPLLKKPENKDIYVFYDKEYPLWLTSLGSQEGMVGHLSAQLTKRNYQGQVKIVDAQKLADLFKKGERAIVVVSSGALPETIYSKNNFLVKEWLEKGGILFFIGDGFGYYSAKKERPISFWDEEVKIGWEGPQRILDYNAFDAPEHPPYFEKSIASFDSLFSKALDLQYSLVKTGALVTEAKANHGEVLGKIYLSASYPRTSIAYLPKGDGGVIVFGSGVFGQEGLIASDISQIICSDYLFSTKHEIFYKEYSLNKKDYKTDEIKVKVPLDAKAVAILAFSKSPWNQFFSKEYVFLETPS